MEEFFEKAQNIEILPLTPFKETKNKQGADNGLKVDFSYGEMSVIDAHQLLNILMGLED